MTHALAKTIIISKVIELIAENYKITIEQARDLFYKSETIDLLDDDETGMYGDSPLSTFSMFEEEAKEKRLI